MNRSRQRLFTWIATTGAALAAFVLAEIAIRFFDARTNAPQQLTDGFLRYDETLGWRLSPHWSGRHRYAGFDVTYAVDASSFRQDPGPAPEQARSQVLFFGDSFTFGLGVADTETFVARLNSPSSKPTSASRSINCGVPGYSTDQQVLLAEAELARRTNVAALRLVVCLANDLLDNPRTHPLQAQMAKCRFALAAGQLVLTNTPVPRAPKPASEAASDLARAMAGPEWRPDLLTRLSRLSGIVQLIHRGALGLRHPPVDFTSVQAENLRLFWALTDRLAATCRAKNIPFELILMPGSSAVMQPQSLPGRYQRWLSDQLVAGAVQRKWPVADLLPALEQAAAQGGPSVFLGDGHLSAGGHAVVAEALKESPPAQ